MSIVATCYLRWFFVDMTLCNLITRGQQASAANVFVTGILSSAFTPQNLEHAINERSAIKIHFY